MKIKLQVLLIFSFFTISLISCDPYVKYDKIIQNDSDFDLLIIAYPKTNLSSDNPFIDDSIVIHKNTMKSIFEVSKIGHTREYKDCNTYADSIVTKILGNDALHLTIDLSDKSNWTFSTLHRTHKLTGPCECRVKITNDMIK